LEFEAVHLRASPHELRVARKDATPDFPTLKFQTTVPHPIPGNLQLEGADGPGMIAVIVGVSLPAKFKIEFRLQKVECKVIETLVPACTL
jgi:hypothetical protein